MEKKERIDFLDYLKAICVILVVVTHYDWQSKHSYIFTMFINMAVPVFMIISGYNFAMSNKRKTDGTMKQMYSPRVIIPKLERFLIPFFAICLVEIVLLMIEQKEINPFRIFFMGAYGPGSYYVPLMIQLLIIFPIIYKLVKKSAKWGIILTGCANLLYEIAVVAFDMEKYYYRLCIGRYLLLIAFGCYLYLHPERRLKKREMAAMLMIGMGYIVLVLEHDMDTTLFDFWKPTAMPIAFYIFPVVVILFRVFYHCHIKGYIGKLLSMIGKASYHIFLVQMVYYHFELGGYIMNKAWYVAVPYNLVITLTIGLLFYELDKTYSSRVTWQRRISW